MAMEDDNYILPNDNELDEALLMKYLEGRLSEEERHVVESQMADSAFVNDAVEGLESFSNKNDIQPYITELNSQLKKHTRTKKAKRLKRKLPDMGWIISTLVIVLLLCLIGFVVLKMHEKTELKTVPSSISK